MKLCYKVLIFIILLSVFVLGIFFLAEKSNNPSPERLERINEFRDLCERNNGTYDRDSMRYDSCYIVEDDFVNIYQFTSYPDGEKLKLYRPYK